MKNLYAKIIMATLVAFFCTQASYAQPASGQNAYLEEEGQGFQEGPSGRKNGGGLERIIQQLNLTDEQKEQLREKREEHKGQIQQMAEYLKSQREDLKEELEKSDADKNRINNIIMEMKETEGRLMYLRTVGILETKDILTPEQFEKLRSFHQKAKQQRRSLLMRHRQGHGGHQEETRPDEY